MQVYFVLQKELLQAGIVELDTLLYACMYACIYRDTIHMVGKFWGYY